MDNIESVCFVGRIEQINPIKGADRIAQAIISGWEAVIAKDKYKIGDYVVIATNDAVIPLALAQKLGVEGYLKNRKKTQQLTVKTVKLKGVYSTALIIGDLIADKKYPEGKDMMERFGITKYEEPLVEMQSPTGRKYKYRKNPNFHVYYKFPNAKNAPKMFTSDDDVVITNKIHGCNARYGIVKKTKLTFKDKLKKFYYNLIGNYLKVNWLDYDFVYGSHTVEKGSDSQGFYSTDVWREVMEDYDLETVLWTIAQNSDRETIGEGIILYGEIYGEGIQKYYSYGEANHKIKFFDLKVNGDYVNHYTFERVCNQWFQPMVEVLYEGKFDEKIIAKLQTGRYIPGTKIPEEGIVVKSITGDRAKIAKYVNPEYLAFQAKKEDSTDFH